MSSSGCYKADLTELTAKNLKNPAGGTFVNLVYKIDDSDLRCPYFHEFSFQSSGSTKSMDIGFPYTNELSIYLFRSTPSGPDRITGTIDDTSETTGTLTFSSGSAEYELAYEVTEKPSTPPAKVAFEDFRSSNEDSEWDNVSQKDLVIGSVLPHIASTGSTTYQPADATALDQDATEYCSNIAVAFTLAWRKPLRFVHFCRALLELGEFLGREEQHEISGALMRSPLAGGMGPLEWVVATSLEDADWIGYDKTVTNNDLHGGAYSWFEQYWVKELVGFENAAIVTDDLGEAALRQQANKAVNNGGCAILGLYGDMVTPGEHLNAPLTVSDADININHAVSLMSPFQSSQGETTYEVHNGRGIHVTVDNPPHPTNLVDKYLYDAVVGW